MKSLKITSGAVLESFLKHIASKSVDAAKKRLVEAGPFKPEDDEESTDDLRSSSAPQISDIPGPQKDDGTEKKPVDAPPPPPSASGAPFDNPVPKKELSPDEIKSYIKKQLENEGNEVTVDRVVNRLNAIRSGRSLKDNDVSAQMEKYFNSLDAPEKVALETFLLGISFIVNPPNDADLAPDPSDKNIDIKLKGDDQSQSTEAHPSSFKQHGNKQQSHRPKPVTSASGTPGPRQARVVSTDNTSVENISSPIRVKKNVP